MRHNIYTTEIEFDLRKSASNKREHGIDFDKAQALWNNPDMIEIPARTEDESRFLVVGRIKRNLLITTQKDFFMAKAKCGYCEKKPAKRFCPSLDKLICPVCCGKNRLKNIDCDEGCRYLDNEQYQQRVRKEKELNLLLENVPHSEHNDIFKNNVAASIAYNFEFFFADCYINNQFNLTDNKVKETLTVLYYVVFKEQKSIPDAFFSEVLKLYNKLKAEYEEELIGQVILRIIISIKKMTGGRFGAYGYLNYLKNNLHPSYIEDRDSHIMELKDGRKYDYKLT